ncbi:MAG: hypothetical protein MUE82_11475, partial [Chloroflexi bacterium]|nr:hypothetical protein [Chloroflexota bacterium]
MRAIAWTRPALGGLAALLLLAAPVPAAGVAPGTAHRVEQAWTASVGEKGANGTASVRILETGTGSLSVSLRGLRASA